MENTKALEPNAEQDNAAIVNFQEAIDKLEENIGKVDTVAAGIYAIASQTNLLVLNATIEAARTGDDRKGFAVVTGEIKCLSA